MSDDLSAEETVKEGEGESLRSGGFCDFLLVAQSCPILCDPMDCSQSGSSVYGLLQARILEWVAIPSPEDLPKPGIKPRSPTLQVDALPAEPQEKIFILSISAHFSYSFCPPLDFFFF